MKVNEVAQLTGVTVRTLHYYDKIGLLKPDSVEENGYRHYSNDSLIRLQQIMFLRELDFTLEQIAEIIDDDGYDRIEALKKQKSLLNSKRDRLDEIIGLIEKTIKGEDNMSFNEFDNTKIEEQKKQYAAEVRERWGATKEYKAFEEKAAGKSQQQFDSAEDGLNALIAQFAAIRHTSPDGDEAQKLVKTYQQFITDNFYPCSKEMLPSLAAMYTGDERFRSNIDKNGDGTAQFMVDAIDYYCNN